MNTYLENEEEIISSQAESFEQPKIDPAEASRAKKGMIAFIVPTVILLVANIICLLISILTFSMAISGLTGAGESEGDNVVSAIFGLIFFLLPSIAGGICSAIDIVISSLFVKFNLKHKQKPIYSIFSLSINSLLFLLYAAGWITLFVI